MAISRLSTTVQDILESEITNKITTFCSAIPEGAMGLFGSSFFIGSMVDLVAGKYTTITPDLFSISRWGYLASTPFAMLAGYGAYKCHYEIGKSSRAQLIQAADTTIKEAVAILDDISIDSAEDESKTQARESLMDLVETLRYEKHKLEEELTKQKNQNKKLDEENKKLNEENKELKAQLEEKNQHEDKEKKAAQSLPLTWAQWIGIAGEYVSHSTGFAGFVLQIVTGEIGFNIEMGITALCVLIGILGAIPETQNAKSCMLVNNLRDKVTNHSQFFKQIQKNQDAEISIQRAENGYNDSNSLAYYSRL